MKATDDLLSEHKGVLRMCGVLEGLAGGLSVGGPLPAQDLAEVLEFLAVFVDKCHHHKEEQLLFPAVRSLAGESTVQLIDKLLAEHDQGRALVATLRSAAKDTEDGGARKQVVEASIAYAGLIREHIREEEERLFPEADRLVPAPQQEELEQGYESVEEEVIGPGRHEAFHHLLDRLEQAYVVEEGV